MEWAVRCSLRMAEVEDRAGTARDGVTDDGQSSAVSSARAWAWRAGRRPSVSASRASRAARSRGVHGLVDCESQVSHQGPASVTLAASGFLCSGSVPGNSKEGLLHRCRRPPTSHHGEVDDDRQAPSGPPGGWFAEYLAGGRALLGQLVEVGDAAGVQQGVGRLPLRRRRGSPRAEGRGPRAVGGRGRRFVGKDLWVGPQICGHPFRSHTRWGCPQAVPLGQELLTVAAVFDAAMPASVSWRVAPPQTGARGSGPAPLDRAARYRSCGRRRSERDQSHGIQRLPRRCRL